MAWWAQRTVTAQVFRNSEKQYSCYESDIIFNALIGSSIRDVFGPLIVQSRSSIKGLESHD